MFRDRRSEATHDVAPRTDGSEAGAQVVTVRLDGMAHGGEAVGRCDGKAVFVPFGVPGELVSVRLVQDRGSYARGVLVDVLEASPQRCTPACRYFGPGLCGGCQWQHIDYSLQLELKARVVREQLARVGRLTDVLVRPAAGMADPWRYRNHIQLLAGPDRSLAYQAAGTNRPVVVAGCPIAHPLLDAMVGPGGGPWRVPDGLTGAGIRRVSLRAGIATGQTMLIAEGTGTMGWRGGAAFSVVADDGRLRLLRGRDFLEERLGGRSFRYSPASFFQVNTAQAERLAELVLAYAALTGGERVLDCFCGVGVFGLLLAPQAAEVIGIEEIGSAVADARHNASGTGNVTIMHGRAEGVMASLAGPIDVAVMDPPRQGCAPAVIAGLLRLSPQRIVYVSCDPATLARDLRLLVDGGYQVSEVTPVDMFPQTYHVETVVLMSKKQ